MIKPTVYQIKPDRREVIELTNANMHEIAKWCGGEIRNRKDDEYILYVPTVNGPITAELGNLVTKDMSGRFNVVANKDKFYSKYEPTNSFHNQFGHYRSN